MKIPAALELGLGHLPDHELHRRHTREGKQPNQRQPATDMTRSHLPLTEHVHEPKRGGHS